MTDERLCPECGRPDTETLTLPLWQKIGQLRGLLGNCVMIAKVYRAQLDQATRAAVHTAEMIDGLPGDLDEIDDHLDDWATP